jgi:hypothetical protein
VKKKVRDETWTELSSMLGTNERKKPSAGDWVSVTGTDGKVYLGKVVHPWVMEDESPVPSEAVKLTVSAGGKEHAVEVVPHRDFADPTVLTYWMWPGEKAREA